MPADAEKVILLVDSDRELLRGLGNDLHESGYDVRAALDGSKALEKAILVHPDLILIDAECPLIPARKFVQILRSNPRTEHIPVIVMIGADVPETTMWGYREAFIRKPFNNDEFLSLVASSFQKMETAQEVREEGREIEGNLNQISLSDLLQIFHINRKTGLLEIKSDASEARIFIKNGDVTHASTHKHHGEKALFRLLQWTNGSFAFIPEKVTGDLNIRRSSDVLLLESARQADELERLWNNDLPAESTRLAVAPGLRDRYEGLHPVTEEIMNLLDFYTSVGELVEHTRVTDYEACRAIRTLLDKGVLQVIDEDVKEEPEDEPLLEHDVMYELKVKLSSTSQPRSRITRAKVCVICDEVELVREFVSGLRKLKGMELEGQVAALKRGFGRLGTLFLSENFCLDWMLLPPGNSMRPLWQPLGVGMVGGVVMHSSQDDQVLYQISLMAQDLSRSSSGIPVLQISPDNLLDEAVEQSTDEAPRLDPLKIRQVVVQLLNRIGSQPKPQRVH